MHERRLSLTLRVHCLTCDSLPNANESWRIQMFHSDCHLLVGVLLVSDHSCTFQRWCVHCSATWNCAVRCNRPRKRTEWSSGTPYKQWECWLVIAVVLHMTGIVHSRHRVPIHHSSIRVCEQHQSLVCCCWRRTVSSLATYSKFTPT